MSNQDIKQAVADGFGEPSYGGSQYENWSLQKDSTTQYRLFPPMKSLRKRRDYTEFWYTHFWEGIDLRNPGKKRAYPVFCIQEKDFSKGGIITKQCPLCAKRELAKNKLKAIEAKGLAGGANKTQVATAQAPTQAWLKAHGHDGKYRFYAMNRAGELGVLRLNSTAAKKLRAEIKTLSQNNHKPLSLDKGVWFEFTRIGNGFRDEDQVKVYRVEDAGGNSKIEFHAISTQLAAAALEVLPDFEEDRRRITYPEDVLERLAAEGDDPNKVPDILGIKAEPDSDSGFDSEAVGVEDDGFAAPAQATAPAAAPAAKAAPVGFGDESAAVADPAEVDEEAALQAQLAAMRAKKAAAAAAAKPAEASKPAAAVRPPVKAAPKPAPTESSFNPEGATDTDFDNLWNPSA